MQWKYRLQAPLRSAATSMHASNMNRQVPKNPDRCGAVEFCLFHGTSNVLWDEVRAQGPG